MRLSVEAGRTSSQPSSIRKFLVSIALISPKV